METRLIQAYDKDGKIVAWCGIPNNWIHDDITTMSIYKTQIENAKGIEVVKVEIV